MKTNGYPTKGLLVLGLSFLVLLLTAGNCATPPLTPTIEHFRANPTIITSGEASTLSWSVRDATRITINQVVGDVSGKTSIAVSPTATTTYTLTAENGPSLGTASVTVTVEAAEIADYVDEEGRRWTAIGPVRPPARNSACPQRTKGAKRTTP